MYILKRKLLQKSKRKYRVEITASRQARSPKKTKNLVIANKSKQNSKIDVKNKKHLITRTLEWWKKNNS